MVKKFEEVLGKYWQFEIEKQTSTSEKAINDKKEHYQNSINEVYEVELLKKQVIQLKNQQSLFTDQEAEITYLERRVWELTDLIKTKEIK